jgi:serine protease
MPTVQKEAQLQKAAKARHSGGINPPAPPCPENGVLYPPPGPVPPGVPYLLGNCGVAQPVATSTPWMGNMAYYGGHVQVHPKEYLIYWGWGQKGAFPGATCTPETFTEGVITASVGCDPDGAAKYMADFVHQMGATNWANTQTQYYQTDSSGTKTYIHNDGNVLAGIWTDDTNDAAALANTNSSNPAGPTNTYTMLAREASRAAAHFGVTGAALNDANFIVVQPPAYSDPNALNAGYCAFHDYTEAGVPGNFYYNDPQVQRDISWTNMPYVLAPALQLGCGMNAVNTDAAGKLDGFSIVLGHEIEETITDPGAEASVGSGANVVQSGGWYDTTDPNENGDKCAWVGENLLTAQGPPLPVPGALGDIQGNAGDRFAVQSLWSNAENQGTGYCAGANTDSPVPAAAYGTGANAPTSTSPPTISGSPAEGQTLTERHGGWTGSPTSYSYQWYDCDSGGHNCSPIPDATTQSYTLTAGDVGSTIVVEETASNSSGGDSAPALSSPTAVVTAPGTGGGGTNGGGTTGSTSATGQTGPAGPAGASGTPRRSVHATKPHHRAKKTKRPRKRKRARHHAAKKRRR